ncbi:Ail/Lom family outer membrane beta-barrel protein [Erwinia oleae]|uniref:Ail/Lom family outer membrane beta-barrel protein n=1 Tax=Erwinia oleae TaxID=796334 RepID=UPI000557A8C9|nr:Ail/Lom family outer membrane beta-barrel protein [Erwinia oleae]
MKYAILAAGLFAVTLTPCATFAGDHTVTLGYSHIKASNLPATKGATVKYRYEWDSPISVIGSLTYARGDDEQRYGYDNTAYAKDKVTYASLMMGPAWRVNDYVSLYGLVGVARAKEQFSYKETYYGSHVAYNATATETKAAWGLGVQINPWENVAIDIGYEGAKFEQVKANGFNVGVGYRF